jgi:hypothetical protein
MLSSGIPDSLVYKLVCNGMQEKSYRSHFFLDITKTYDNLPDMKRSKQKMPTTTERPATNDRRTTVTISIPGDLLNRAKETAAKEYRNISSMIEVLMREAFERREKPNV